MAGSDWLRSESSEIVYEAFRPGIAHPHAYSILLFADEPTAGASAVDSNPFRHVKFERLLDRKQLSVICPLRGDLWRDVWSLDHARRGADPKDTPRQLVLERILPAIFSELGSQPPGIALVGFGSGGQAALRLAYDYPDKFPVVAAIAPKIDFHLLVRDDHPVLTELFADEEAARQHTAILHVHPLNWPRHHFFCCDPANYAWYDGADRLRMKLAASGIPFECDLETSTDGDLAAYVELMAETVIDFVERGMERERLRLV
jgi:S-formylglutathione hydrolase